MSADILRDLARVKAVFQLRAIEAIIGGEAQGIEARSEGTLQAAQPEGREPGPKDAPDEV